MSNIIDFRIEYSLLDSMCGGDFSVLEGIIASPNYPSIYPESIECIWFIRAAAGSKLSLNVLDLDIFQADSGGCSSESYLEIHESSSSGQLLDVLCGNENQTKAYLGAGFWIKFESGTGYRGRGFELQFEYGLSRKIYWQMKYFNKIIFFISLQLLITKFLVMKVLLSLHCIH